ncbi:hypothetical protein [Agreia sp. VKM Ac-1783]|uniref:hypothetical protein n=1 Tax=Agreia sp. VKM Ac-1783 TaxID=1938889 RepID=UPI0014829486|nr:hypothetical protein [Agreia sp. VKM Ac-1783]
MSDHAERESVSRLDREADRMTVDDQSGGIIHDGERLIEFEINDVAAWCRGD